MTRTFLHSFDPPADSPVTGATVDLTVAEIEDAEIREVLQTPGTAYGAWSILDALLTPTGAGTPFIFKEPLGQTREVKVALSGLFGRFVARAYLERFFNLSIFAHLGSRVLDCASFRSSLGPPEKGPIEHLTLVPAKEGRPQCLLFDPRAALAPPPRLLRPNRPSRNPSVRVAD